MRVEVLESLPEADAPPVNKAPDGAVDRALKNFFAALESEDSIFMTEKFGVAVSGDNGCIGTMVLRFREERQVSNRGLNFLALEKLAELLKDAGSAESLAARMMLAHSRGDGAKPEIEIRLRLDSKGNSVEQAALRWSLGLAHVQQALLFTSRLLRQQIGQNGD